MSSPLMLIFREGGGAGAGTEILEIRTATIITLGFHPAVARHAIRWKTCDTQPNEDFWVRCRESMFPSSQVPKRQPTLSEAASWPEAWRECERAVYYGV